MLGGVRAPLNSLAECRSKITAVTEADAPGYRRDSGLPECGYAPMSICPPIPLLDRLAVSPVEAAGLLSETKRKPKIITRKAALARGLSRYYTGKPCKNGHVVERRTRNETCLACELDYQRRYEQSPKGHETQHRYNQSPKGHETQYRYRQSPKGHETQHRYDQSPKGLERRFRANRSPKSQERKLRYQQSPKGRARINDRARERRLERVTEQARHSGLQQDQERMLSLIARRWRDGR
jgi:hypothetical protein